MKPVPESFETNFEVRTLDRNIPIEEYQKLSKRPVIFILDNLRSAFNVGSIFRLSDALRIEAVYLCGITAAPPNPRLAKTSMGSVDFVPWKQFSTTEEAINFARSIGYKVWGVETGDGAIHFADMPIGSAHPDNDKVAFVFGNEALGISEDALELCEKIVELPVYGFKNSINVAAACAVVGYAAVGKMSEV